MTGSETEDPPSGVATVVRSEPKQGSGSTPGLQSQVVAAEADGEASRADAAAAARTIRSFFTAANPTRPRWPEKQGFSASPSSTVRAMNPRTAVIIAALALVVGAVGVFIGIDAKNTSSDAQDSS